MTRTEMRAYLRANPIEWPELNATQRMRLAALLRPDMPVGIRTSASTVAGVRTDHDQEAA